METEVYLGTLSRLTVCKLIVEEYSQHRNKLHVYSYSHSGISRGHFKLRTNSAQVVLSLSYKEIHLPREHFLVAKAITKLHAMMQLIMYHNKPGHASTSYCYMYIHICHSYKLVRNVRRVRVHEEQVQDIYWISMHDKITMLKVSHCLRQIRDNRITPISTLLKCTVLFTPH